jgi:hypothetical protein
MKMALEKDEVGDSGFPVELSRPALGALREAGYKRLEELVGVKAADLLKLHGMGPKGIRILREALKGKGLAFAGEK